MHCRRGNEAPAFPFPQCVPLRVPLSRWIREQPGSRIPGSRRRVRRPPAIPGSQPLAASAAASAEPLGGSYVRSCERRRGSILTRVPASSIDSSAPPYAERFPDRARRLCDRRRRDARNGCALRGLFHYGGGNVYEEIRRRVGAIPGVRSAVLTRGLPMQTVGVPWSSKVPRRQPDRTSPPGSPGRSGRDRATSTCCAFPSCSAGHWTSGIAGTRSASP